MAEETNNTPSPQDLHGLTLRYLDSELTEAELANLRGRLSGDAQSARRFVQSIQMAAMIREQTKRARSLRQELALPEDNDARGSEVVRSLHHADREGHDLEWFIAEMDCERRAATKHREADTNAITPRQALSLAGYVLGQALTSKPALKAYAIAAALLLAVTLFLVFNASDDDTTPDPLAAQAPTPGLQIDPPVLSAPHVVATLTAEIDAVWDRRPGEDLYAGQRVTLTQGFAEITTKRGAVAIIEAPATLELTDSNNAIHLHTGKLVGICETASSKGFTVSTSNLSVVDLGTEFGVEFDAARQMTRVQVYHGTVSATVKDAVSGPREPVLLSASESAVISQGTSLRQAAFEPGRFKRPILPNDRAVRAVSGGIVLPSPPLSIGLGQLEQDDKIVLFAERRGVVLNRNLPLSITRPGEYQRMPQDDPEHIAAGTIVDSYLLHFDAVGEPEVLVQTEAEFVFDQPILGLIVSHTGMQQTDALLGAEGVTYPDAGTQTRGLEGTEHKDLDIPLDSVRLSEDRTRLSIRMGTSDMLDQIRVIVASRSDE